MRRHSWRRAHFDWKAPRNDRVSASRQAQIRLYQRRLFMMGQAATHEYKVFHVAIRPCRLVLVLSVLLVLARSSPSPASQAKAQFDLTSALPLMFTSLQRRIRS